MGMWGGCMCGCGEGVRDVDGDDERCGSILLKLFFNLWNTQLLSKYASCQDCYSYYELHTGMQRVRSPSKSDLLN